MAELRTYTCEACGGSFVDGWTEEEAIAEAVELGMDLDNSARVCDDCFRRLMKWAGRE